LEKQNNYFGGCSKNMNETFCILPWLHLYVHTDGNVFPCCTSWAGKDSAVLGSIKSESLEHIFNTDKIKQLRLDMLSNKHRNDVCFKCYTQEKHGYNSPRIAHNQRFQHLTKNLISSTATNGEVSPNIKSIDIRLTNTCNLKCRKCNPQLSSAIEAEQKNKTILIQDETSIEILEEQYPNIEHIYFAGGEPSLMKYQYDILVKLIDLGRAHEVSLDYNINGTNLKYKSLDLLSLWSKFKRVNVLVSIDGIDEHAEYIRHGFKWQLILKNIHKLMEYQKTSNNFHLGYFCTVDILNVHHIIDLTEYFKNTGLITDDINMSYHILMLPRYYNIDILPAKIKLDLVTKINTYVDTNKTTNNLSFFETLKLQLMKNHDKDFSNELKEFKKVTMNLDRIRGENFCNTFPYYKEMWDNITI
jgi:radical SAM protein with 4Fe4S-binding SPASM domain